MSFLFTSQGRLSLNGEAGALDAESSAWPGGQVPSPAGAGVGVGGIFQQVV